MTVVTDLIDYSLWRGGALMGRVRIPFPSNSDGIFGMLEVEPGFADIEELMQVRDPWLPNGPIRQSLLRDAHRGPGPVALRELPAEEQRGLRPEQVFEVRDAAGVGIAYDMLMITKFPEPIPRHGELVDVCGAHGIRPSPWVLSVDRLSSSRAS